MRPYLMKANFLLCVVLSVFFGSQALRGADKPLRIFLRADASSVEDKSVRFRQDWQRLLSERGAIVSSGTAFPTRRELAATDVVVLYGGRSGVINAEDKRNLQTFLRRGGGIVVLHDAIKTADAGWFQTLVGGGWDHGQSRSTNTLFGLYFNDYPHPITEGISNFDLDDEFYFRLHLATEVKVLASTFNTAKEIVPQIWVYETERGRAFVALPGQGPTLAQPHYRGLILRGIAWAGKRPVDALTRLEETVYFRYPQGGPTSPEEAKKKIKTQPEFDLSLVAAEPLLVKPISVDWDPRGRMWVAVTPEYPFKTDSTPPKDAILILEDSDRDERMDGKQVFYEGLNLVTSFVFYRDGIIVAQAPEILWLRDSNGDGIADRREVLFRGFGTYDTHAVISNFRWSMDGWIYATQGYSGRDSTNVVNQAGRSFGRIPNGILRFKPDGSAMESVSSFSGNTWGLDFNWENELFFSKANGPHATHLVMPEKFLARGVISNATSDKAIEDHQKVTPIFTDPRHEYVQVAPVGVFTGASGAMIYDGGAWPEKYHGSFYVCEPTVHIVHEDVIHYAESPTYEATKRQEGEFIAATDLWFRPVHCRVGPDGAMYILDFYNQAISHNDIRGIAHGRGNAAVRPDRDHQHGRIWRVQHKLARHHEVPELADATPAELGRALEHPNGWVRQTAQRLLLERGDRTAVPVISQLLTNRLPQTRIQALWAMHQLHALKETNLITALKDSHPSVLKNVLLILADQEFEPSPAVEKAIVAEGKDGGERARLLALLALGQWRPSSEQFKAGIKLYPDVKDNWSRSAVLGLARMDPYEAIKTGFGDKADSYRDLVPPLIATAARQRDGDLLARIIQHMAERKKDTDKLKVVLLDQINRNLSANFLPTWSTNLEQALHKLLDSEGRSVRVATLPLANRWPDRPKLQAEVRKVRDHLLVELESGRLKDEERLPLVTSLLSVEALQPRVIAALDKVLPVTRSDDYKKHIIKEVGRTKEKSAANLLVAHYSKLNEEQRQLAFATLARRDDWSLTLLDALETKSFKTADIGPQGVMRLRTHPDRTVAKRAAQVFDKLQGPPPREKEKLIARFQSALDQTPDLKNGKTLFRQSCAICHKFDGEGKDLGPDLTGVGLHGGLVLLTHVLDPNRVVEGNFIPENVTTKKEEEHFGLVMRENKETLTLKGLEGEIEIKKDDIVQRISTGLSLMPEGFEALGEKNLGDIIGYMVANTPKGYRALDLANAFTADSRRALYAGEDDKPAFDFKRFGIVMVENVPFNIASPEGTASGKNVVVLRGGLGWAKSMPAKVEFPIGARATKLHVLGGVGGWAYPYGPPEDHGVAVAKAILHYVDGQTEQVIFHNGQEFADLGKQIEVPGSTYAPDLIANGQLRWFTLTPKRPVLIQKITLESSDSHVAPAFVAMTAQVAE